MVQALTLTLGRARPQPSLPSRTPSPFLKWAGGKGRVLPQLQPLLPQGIGRMRHVEPFVGGGALFFSRLPARALLCDINPALIDTYRAVQGDVESVIEHLQHFAAQHSTEFYYLLRRRYNEERDAYPVERAAMFIYLNKTCFNGLHRVNRRGEFNVPAGRYAQPKIVDPAGLRAASAALALAELRCGGFEHLLAWARPGDFIYLDPPYAPRSATSCFTTYAEEGFGNKDQEELSEIYRVLDRRGCKLMLSNSDVPLIRALYANWRIDTIEAARAVNCNAQGRGKVSELVIRNY